MEDIKRLEKIIEAQQESFKIICEHLQTEINALKKAEVEFQKHRVQHFSLAHQY